MNSYQKRCRICVDKAMDKFTKSVVTEDKKFTKSYVIEEKYIHRLLDNKPCDPIDISDDNEEIDDVESNIVSDVKINEFWEETTDVICLDKNNEVLQNEVHMNEYGVEEKDKENDVEEKAKENDVMIDKSS